MARFRLAAVICGSSPLTRGKLDAEGPAALRGRLIPAHAGKTRDDEPPTPRSSAHPRSRGENRQGMALTAHKKGSSPLTRGKPDSSPQSPPWGRLIPAHAGKTEATAIAVNFLGAHPRSRGENIKAAVSVVVEWGSSPLTRGKPRRQPLRHRAARLIPAHAGKTARWRRREPKSWAHPRSRGENIMEQTADAHGAGSSPLTRGKPMLRPRGNYHAGLIPAHAGKTIVCPFSRRAAGAHPRSRGENL